MKLCLPECSSLIAVAESSFLVMYTLAEGIFTLNALLGLGIVLLEVVFETSAKKILQ